MNDIDERLTEIVSKVLLLDKGEVTDGLRRKEYEPWDSMAHLVLISEVENEFGIFFEDEEVVDIWTVGDLRKIVASKLGV
ncbi:MAG: acyl carrier protein [Candidatus Thorarchaeota archaeon]|nr:MAG: acyl carrier protein [Candidatus Thorarchaeota archaeon]